MLCAHRCACQRLSSPDLHKRCVPLRRSGPRKCAGPVQICRHISRMPQPLSANAHALTELRRPKVCMWRLRQQPFEQRLADMPAERTTALSRRSAAPYCHQTVPDQLYCRCSLTLTCRMRWLSKPTARARLLPSLIAPPSPHSMASSRRLLLRHLARHAGQPVIWRASNSYICSRQQRDTS